MLISTKDLTEYLKKLYPNDSLSPFESEGDAIILSKILKDIASWEAQQINEMGEPPFSYGIDSEKALVVYCTPKLYEYVESFDIEKEDTFGIVQIGKLYLEVKKFLKDGKFKRLSK